MILWFTFKTEVQSRDQVQPRHGVVSRFRLDQVQRVDTYSMNGNIRVFLINGARFDVCGEDVARFEAAMSAFGYPKSEGTEVR